MQDMRWRNGSCRPRARFCAAVPPTIAKRAPAGPDWVYELKHDGYRLLVRREADHVRVFSRNGADFTERFPRIVEAARRLRVQSALLDGEGIVYNGAGMPSFRLLHGKQNDAAVTLVAFDLLELDGTDVRAEPLLDREQRLVRLLTSWRAESSPTTTPRAPARTSMESGSVQAEE
jgi:bifunctional non-homologous end joining protein LigD